MKRNPHAGEINSWFAGDLQWFDLQAVVGKQRGSNFEFKLLLLGPLEAQVERAGWRLLVTKTAPQALRA